MKNKDTSIKTYTHESKETITLTEEQINLFFDEFKIWQIKLGLEHIEVFNVVRELTNSYAQINYDTQGCSTLSLNASFPMFAIVDVNEKLKQSAKHEAMHLLLGDFSAYASTRHVSEGELNDAEEILVRRLVKLIN